MSGGVDSSATAAILCQKGYDCIGVTMKLYNLPDDAVRSNTCCTLSDAEDAKSVAYQLGMRYYVMNFTADFAKEVIDRFVSAYERGETPRSSTFSAAICPILHCMQSVHSVRLKSHRSPTGQLAGTAVQTS